jgi:hypothetical protein
MKLFLKILAGILIFFIVLIIGLNLYFTDERLKAMILPEVRETVGTDVQVERMSLTFFRTFPRFGVELGDFILPDPDGEPVVTFDELLIGIELFPLLRDEISISQLRMIRPALTYRVFEDESTNIDFLLDLADEEPEPGEDGYAISISRFTIQDGLINYRDDIENTIVTMAGLDASISLRFDELIESVVEAELASLTAIIDETTYIDNLALSLNQISTIDLDNEILTITEGELAIRGLGLNLSGTVTDWGSEAPVLDIQFASSSDNFGELLRLAPPEYDDQLAGLETRGALVLEGSITGSFTEEDLPAFDLIVNVSDGYLQNPDLPEAIEDINISLTITNELATLSEFRARAAENTVNASGTVERPLDDDAVFSVAFDGDVNLATVSQFYPIDELGIQDMNGLLTADLTANGRIDLPEEASFSGNFSLTDGSLQYIDVPRPIEQINAIVQASHEQVIIEESGFRAADNLFTMSGSVTNPLDEDNRNVDLSAVINFDLATIKEFYPIDEDTLSLRGQFDANVVLRGAADPDRLEELLQRGTFQLHDGYIAHHSLGQPIEDITFEAEARGSVLSINTGRFTTGQNSLAMRGSISNYLSEEPLFDLTFDGTAVLGDIANYYSLEPWIQELSGDAVLSLNARGQAGDPQQIALNGSLEVSNVNAVGDSLPLPVTDLNGKLNITPDAMTLEEFVMNFGSSDIALEGRVENYLGFLEENHTSTATMPAITGTYRSRLLDLDEMIDWDEEADPDEPIPIELPAMTSQVTAQIDRLIFFGIPITDISGSGRTTPDQILLDEATATLFDGTATGTMEWNVPNSDRTNISFEGSLSGLTAEAFFRETGFLGANSNFHEFVTGEFSTDISYFTELDHTVTPDLTTTRADGTFGMTRARMRGHPIQEQVASFLNVDELRNLALDEWTATYTIDDSILTFEDFSLTSENIGLELEGTQHMIDDTINYRATMLLPSQFRRGIASVISDRAVDVLQREDGTIAVPIRITGTATNPQVRQDTELIERIIRDAARDGAEDVLRRIFGG